MKELMDLAGRVSIKRVCHYPGKSLIQNPTAEQLRAVKGWNYRMLGFVYATPNTYAPPRRAGPQHRHGFQN